ncbi:MAG: cytochrome c-type biogenesis CcmF C-terminal domain-containing protein [Dehalococcoidia bacterium]
MNVLATVGASAVLTALGASIFAGVAGVAAVRTRRGDLGAAGRRAVVVAAIFVTLAIGTLATALLRDDFSLAYVASVSSADMLPHMKWAALYSSQAGSLLFWTWVTAVLLAVLALRTLPRMAWGANHAVAASGIVLTAFLVAVAFLASPFEVSRFDFADGRGLNPLLVDRGMLVHPPMLLAGLASTAVPFVIAGSALVVGRTDDAWIRVARPWVLFSWVVLSAGNFLGAWWAYTVLGWGGFWGWDPVENSALLPLLPLTALLHSMMVQERRGMLKSWNFGLVLAAFALAVFGTFNVRSGLVASVHSFAQSEVGPYFLGLVGLTLAASAGLMAWRTPRLRAEGDFVSLASRETTLVVNNYVLIAIALVVLGGTLFPVFSELINGSRITVGPPFYNQVAGPLLIVLITLITVGTVMPWRQGATATLVRRFRAPVLVTVLAGVVLAVLGMHDPFALATTCAAVAVVTVTVREYAIGARGVRASRGGGVASWPGAFFGLFERDQRRYGGYLVHIGVAIIAIGAMASTVYQQQTRASVGTGESFEFAGMTFTNEGIFQRAGVANGIDSEVIVPLSVSRDGEVIDHLEPGSRLFVNFSGQPMTIVGLHSTLTHDLYAFVEGWDENGVAQVQVFVNPLLAWLWIGGAIYIVGGLIAFAPSRAPSTVRDEATAPAAARA